MEAHAVAMRPSQADAPSALRGVPHRIDDALRIEGGLHRRHDYAPSSGIHDPAGFDRVVGGQTDERHTSGQIHHLDQRKRRGQVDGAVLEVDAEPVETRLRHDLGDARMAELQPGSEGRAPSPQGRSEIPVHSHAGAPVASATTCTCALRHACCNTS
jgi:hypothetical protein